MMDLRQASAQALAICDPAQKCAAVFAMAADADVATSAQFDAADEPGRPSRPELVHPRKLKQRSLHSQSGRIALVHAVAHIEFNAINLALDAMVRFAHMPQAYYRDWLSVAVDEARHFSMLSQRLEEMDAAYGDLPAHNGLWEMAQKTAHDPLVRMALVPRVLEARGLDVSPGMIEKLDACGDEATADLLRVILREEEAHVAIGSRWFAWLCQGRGLEPQATFLELVEEYLQGGIRPPINSAARARCGFGARELEIIEKLANSH